MEVVCTAILILGKRKDKQLGSFIVLETLRMQAGVQ